MLTMDPRRRSVKGHGRVVLVRRHLSVAAAAVAAAVVCFAVAGFLAGPGPTAATSPSTRTLSSPLVDMEAVSSTAPRLDGHDSRLRLPTARTAVPAVLLFGGTLALVASAYVSLRRRPRRAVSRPAWSASLRGPPRLAAL